LDSSVFDQAEFLLRASVTGAGGLAQQVLADPAIPGIAALAAHQLAEATLRRDHPFPGRLLEQAAGEVLGILAVAKSRAVQQPFGHAHGKSLGSGNTRELGGNRFWSGTKLHKALWDRSEGAPLYSFFRTGKVEKNPARPC